MSDIDDDNDDDVGTCKAVEVVPHLASEIREVKWTNRLIPFQIRIVGDICPQVAADVEVLLRRATQTGQSHIVLDLHSDGGCVYSALKIVDMLDACELPIITVAKGNAQSAAAVIFSCGTQRVISPRGMVMVHSVRGCSAYTMREMQLDLKETERINKQMCQVIARTTPKRRASYYEKMVSENVDINYSAEDALREGIATDIGYVNLKTHVRVETTVDIVPMNKTSLTRLRKKRRLA